MANYINYYAGLSNLESNHSRFQLADLVLPVVLVWFAAPSAGFVAAPAAFGLALFAPAVFVLAASELVL